MKRYTKIIALASIALLIVIVAVLASKKAADDTEDTMSLAVNKDTIYNNIFVNDVELGGLSKKEAIKKLEKDLDLSKKKINVSAEDNKKEYQGDIFGAKYNIEKAVEEAWGVARTKTINERYLEIIDIEKNSLKIIAEVEFDEELLNEGIEFVKTDFDVQGKRPSLSRSSGVFAIIPGEAGKEINEESLKGDIKKSIEKMDFKENIELEMQDSNHEKDLELLAEVKDQLASYTTNTSTSAGNRYENVRLAANSINSKVLYPGEVFSTDKAFMPRTKENGYKPAPVIIEGEFVDDFGGGICQVSSTLYNTVLYSELEVVERQNHALQVGYVPISQDATIASGSIDFKFKNNLDYPIYIESGLSGNKLTISIYGKETRPANRKIEFVAAVSYTAQPIDIETKDASLVEGKRVVDSKGHGGIQTTLFKYIYIDGKKTESVKVNSSSYISKASKVRVGTAKTETTSEKETKETTEKPSEAKTNKVETTTEAVKIDIETTIKSTEAILE